MDEVGFPDKWPFGSGGRFLKAGGSVCSAFTSPRSGSWCEVAFDTGLQSATTVIAGTSGLYAGVELGAAAQGIVFVIRIG